MKIITPPTNFGVSMPAGPYIEFEGRGSTLTINFRIKILSVLISYDGSGLPGIQLFTASGAHNVLGSWFLGANPYYMPEPIIPFIIRFMRLRFKKVCFEYTPRVAGGTSSGNALTWAWMQDCCGPESHGYAFFSGFGYGVSEEQLSQISGSRQFPVWEPSECLDVTGHLDTKQWFYCAGPDFNTAFSGSDVSADQRQFYGGVLLVAANDNSPSTENTTATQGAIWLRGSIELKDLVPPATAQVSLSTMRGRKLPVKEQSKTEEKKTEVVETPSSAKTDDGAKPTPWTLLRR